MAEQPRIHIVELCRRIGRHHETIENRFQDMPNDELTATLETEKDKPDFLHIVTAKLSELIGITREDVAEFIHRTTNGGNWSKWNRADGSVWPDISDIAQKIITADTGNFLTDRIEWLMWTSYPDEAQAIGLNKNGTPDEKLLTTQTIVSENAELLKDIGGEALAMAVLVKHPEWTLNQIAEVVGCNRRTLHKWTHFKQARSVLKSGRDQFPRGTKDGKTGTLEAHDGTK